jgi:hypothetical protein
LDESIAKFNKVVIFQFLRELEGSTDEEEADAVD